MLKIPKILIVLACTLLVLSTQVQAQFGDLLKNVRQIGQAANNLGGFSSELQAFVKSIQSITEVTIAPQTNSPQQNQDLASDKVVLYTTARCGYCKLAMKHVKERQIPYVEKDIDVNSSYAAEFKRIGGNGVPHILMGPTVMRGFAANNFDKQYNAWKATTSPSQQLSSSPSTSTPATTTTTAIIN